jgi:hypothetical protein
MPSRIDLPPYTRRRSCEFCRRVFGQRRWAWLVEQPCPIVVIWVCPRGHITARWTGL